MKFLTLKTAAIASAAILVGTVWAQHHNLDHQLSDKVAYALDQSSNGKELKIKVGQQIVVTLPTNPTTGYQLFMLTTGDEPFSISSKNYVQDAHEPGRVGVGGKNQYVFTAWRKGMGAISLVSARVFDLEKSLKSTKPWQVSVTVE